MKGPRPALDAAARTDRAILRTAVIVASSVAVILPVVGIATGEWSRLVPAGLAGLIALYALWRLNTGRSAVPILFVSVLAITLDIAARQDFESVASGTLGIVGLSLATALLTNRRAILASANTGMLAIVTLLRVLVIDEALSDLIAGTAVAVVVTFFGIQVIEWTKDEITGRQSRFENLFDHVPVAIWEEDFTRVAAWLDELRALGVTDLREYLRTNPDTVRYGASLIEVLDVNDETLRFLEAPDRESVLGPLNPDLIVEDSLGALVEEIVAIWEDRPKLRIDMAGANLVGGHIEGFLLMTAPQTAAGIDWSSVVIAMVDVSEQIAAQRRLQELVDSKDRFVASVSHELRTPLTTVIGLAEELRFQNGTIGVDERDELLGLIADQATEVGNIVEDLLVAAQADIGRISIVREPVYLTKEVHDLVALLDLPSQPAIDIVGDIHPIVDPRRLRQILRNLVTNAYRYGGETVLISARQEGESMVLEVRDNGDGVPDDLKERIFEPYETAYRAVGVTESVGLGLTVSRELARLMDGDLTYYRIGATTVFQLMLPATLDTAESPTVPQESVVPTV